MTGESVVEPKEILTAMKEVAKTKDFHALTFEDRQEIEAELGLKPNQHQWLLRYSEDGKKSRPEIIKR